MEEFLLLGAAFGPHGTYEHVCVMVFAKEIKDNASISLVDQSFVIPEGGKVEGEFEKSLKSTSPGEKLVKEVTERLNDGYEVFFVYILFIIIFLHKVIIHALSR